MFAVLVSDLLDVDGSTANTEADFNMYAKVKSRLA